MTQTLIPANLPVYFQSLAVPCKWTARQLKTKGQESETEYTVTHQPGSATSFNPWQKRDEFFRLRSGDRDGLLALLGSVGVWQKAGSDTIRRYRANTVFFGPDRIIYEAEYQSRVHGDMIWSYQTYLQKELQKTSKDFELLYDYTVQIRRDKEPRVLLTTVTFEDALALTVNVDRVMNARVVKCARPDCGILFSHSSGHERKYCRWYCGHIESVRKAREKSGQTKGR